MADSIIKIEDLNPVGGALKGTAQIPISQDKVDYRVSVGEIEQSVLTKVSDRYLEKDKKIPNENLTFGEIKDGDNDVISGGNVHSKLTDDNLIVGFYNILKNNSFTKGTESWRTNETVIKFTVENGIAKIDTTGANDPAITQSVIINKGKNYILKYKCRIVNDIYGTLRIGYGVNLFNNKIINSEWAEYVVYLNAIDNSNIFIIAPPKGSIMEFEYVIFSENKGSSIFAEKGKIEETITEKVNKVVDEKLTDDIYPKMYFNLPPNKIVNPEFTKGIDSWKTNETIIKFTVENGIAKIDTTGANDPAIYQKIAVDSGKYRVRCRVRKVSGDGSTFRLALINSFSRLYSIDNNFKVIESIEYISAYNDNLLTISPLKNTVVEVDWVELVKITDSSVFKDIEDLKSKNKDTSYFPKKTYSKTPILNSISNFVTEYNNREKDIVVVSTGDSITTPLNWSLPRLDAKFRPPMMTEFNTISMIEEQLRFHDMKYNRYDVESVFTEILGGGNSIETTADINNWGYVGNAYYLPYTKVIDNGTNSGVSFVLKTHVRRLNLIVHTDKSWADKTKIEIQQGNGKVLVFNGIEWVEANGFELSLKEQDTKASLGFYTDNAQKRIQLKAVNHYEDINITVKNIGVGRFAYWGIEETKHPYTFSFIASSKGSHSDTMLQKYDKWMIEDFRPNLIIYQCPILNSGFGIARSTGSINFGKQFSDRAKYLKTKNNCEVLSVVMWGSTTSNLFDNNGDYTSTLAQNGQFVSCQMDVKSVVDNFKNESLELINIFDLMNNVAEEKSIIESSNKRLSALNASGKDGNTFTFDGIHLNTQGNKIAYNILFNYFNI